MSGSNRNLSLLAGIFLLAGAHSEPVSLQSGSSICLISWNLENFFDPEDDPETEDEEFTPGGLRHWTWNRFNSKAALIWKTLIMVFPGTIPDVIFLSEIENEKVLEKLFRQSPLYHCGYRWIHRDSPDPRGIDVAIVYRSDRFTCVHHSFHEPGLIQMGGRGSREMVYGKFRCGTDIFHLIANHWPSKYGGAGLTDPFREQCGKFLKHLTDSILFVEPHAKIIAAGDFNESTEGKGLVVQDQLNCMRPAPGPVEGTIKYQGFWEVIDHFLVSPSLCKGQNFWKISGFQPEIFSSGHLLVKDEVYGGIKPFRTMEGYTYKGGVSDHLPILMKLERAVP